MESACSCVENGFVRNVSEYSIIEEKHIEKRRDYAMDTSEPKPQNRKEIHTQTEEKIPNIWGFVLIHILSPIPTCLPISGK